MNGPLLISLLPPEWTAEATRALPAQVPCVAAVLFLAGILLSLWLRLQGRRRSRPGPL